MFYLHLKGSPINYYIVFRFLIVKSNIKIIYLIILFQTKSIEFVTVTIESLILYLNSYNNI